MRLDRLPVGEAIIGFLLIALVAGFLVAKHEIDKRGDDINALAAASATPSPAPQPSGETPSPGALAITLTDNHFDNTALTATAGTAATVTLKNNGTAVHNVHISDATGKFTGDFCSASGPDPCSNPTRLTAGASGTLTFTLPAGTYQYRCDYHPTEMKGTLTVH